MSRLRVLLGVLALVAFGGLLLGDDPKKAADAKKDPPPKTTHSLPQGWKQLGLSDDQKKKIYAIEDEYEPKVAALKKQIEELQKKEKAEKYAVLSEDQKKKLKEIRETKDGGGTEPKKDDKKPDKSAAPKDEKKDEKKP
jgi:Spy/CpxP family protein refolding chaperone